MNDNQLNSVAGLSAFVTDTTTVTFALAANERYAFIERTLRRFGYTRLRRVDKAVVLRFLEHVSGYSRRQLTRLVERTRNLTDKEFETLVSSLPRKLALMARWSYLTGMRESNMLAMKLTDASEAGATYVPIKHRKGRPPRPVLLEWTDALRQVWTEAAGARIGAVPLFPTAHGTEYSRDSFQSIWQRWRNKIAITDLRWHDIRRKTGSDSASDAEATERLDHADGAITKAHYRAKPKRIKPLR